MMKPLAFVALCMLLATSITAQTKSSKCSTHNGPRLTEVTPIYLIWYGW